MFVDPVPGERSSVASFERAAIIRAMVWLFAGTMKNGDKIDDQDG